MIIIFGSREIVVGIIWDIANAVPVLDFWKSIKVMKETESTIVLIEPKRIKNCSRVDFPKISEAIIAAWDEPNPGKSEHMGEIRRVARVGFIISGFFICNFSIDCGGRDVFCEIE